MEKEPHGSGSLHTNACRLGVVLTRLGRETTVSQPEPNVQDKKPEFGVPAMPHHRHPVFPITVCQDGSV